MSENRRDNQEMEILVQVVANGMQMDGSGEQFFYK